MRLEEIPSVAQVNQMKKRVEKMEGEEQQHQTENNTGLRDLRPEIEEKIVSMNQWLAPRP